MNELALQQLPEEYRAEWEPLLPYIYSYNLKDGKLLELVLHIPKSLNFTLDVDRAVALGFTDIECNYNAHRVWISPICSEIVHDPHNTYTLTNNTKP